MPFSQSIKAKLTFSILLLFAMVLFGCDSPEEAAEEHLKKGKELFEKGEYDKAILELKTSSQARDQRSDTYYYMALLDEKGNNFRSMRENLQKTIELDPNNIEARQKLGKVHLLFGDMDKALEQANFLLKATPDSEEAKLLKASVYMKQNKSEQAKEIIDSVLSVNALNIDALSLKTAQAFSDNELKQATEVVDTALRIDDKNLPLRLFKIKIDAKQNNIDAVIDDYKKLIELYPDSENFKLNLASIYAMADKLQPAEALLREIIAKKPDSVGPKIILLEFLNAKDKARVSAEFKSMLAVPKITPENVLELSKWMLASEYGDDGVLGLNRVVESEKGSNIGLTAQTILAEIFLNKKEYEKAEKSIADILAENSDFVDANLLKARLFLMQNKVDQAIELLNKTVWIKSDSDNAYMLLGQAYTIKNDKKQADKNYKLALEINPANIHAFMPVFNGYLQANQKETARQLLDKALKAKPNQLLLLTSKADLDIAEKRWDDAQETVQRIALFSKSKAIPLYLKANILQGRGQYADAVKLYENLLDEFPGNLNALLNLVRSYDALKQREKAVSFIEALHEKHKEDLTIVGVLSDLYAADKDYVKAKQLLTNQIKIVPDKAIPLYMALAKIEAILQKSAEGAKDVYLKGLQSNPDSPQLLMALAGLYEQLGNRSEARGIYERILSINPDYVLAINNLAALLLESNNSEELAKGLKLAERFKDSENVYFQDTYAWSLIKTGNSKVGLAVLESLIVKEPKSAELRYHLGVAHLKNGNKATALVELKQSISLAESQRLSFSGKDEAAKLIKELNSR